MGKRDRNKKHHLEIKKKKKIAASTTAQNFTLGLKTTFARQALGKLTEIATENCSSSEPAQCIESLNQCDSYAKLMTFLRASANDDDDNDFYAIYIDASL